MNTGEKEKHQTGGYDDPGEQNHNLMLTKPFYKTNGCENRTRLSRAMYHCRGGHQGGPPTKRKKIEREKPIGIMDGWALPQPLLDKGQGKLMMSDMEISESSGDESGPTVVGALTAVGQEIALACGENPTKVLGSDKILPRLQQIYDGWRKEDPATTKQLPVEADVPKCLAERAQRHSATELDRAVGDLTLVAFYYLLRIGEYMIKGNRNETKQTVQFKREDITFFKKNRRGQLQCLPRDAGDDLIATANGAT
jgi:hypothetical protein